MFMLGAFPAGETLPYLDYENIAAILDRLGRALKDKHAQRNQFTEKLFIPILDSIAPKATKAADLILAAILSAMPPFKANLHEDRLNLQCIIKWLSVALKQKQFC